ncbi:MAG: DUF2085 domain-containing protein [Herpetosiphon sp.]
MNTQDILDQARRELVTRHASVAQQQEQRWLWAFIGLASTLVIGIWFLPGATLGDRLHVVVQGVCAQQHFLYLGPLQMPLCARNTGIYAGFLATLLYIVALGRGRAGTLPPMTITVLLGLGIMAMAVDGTNSLLLDLGNYNIYPPHNLLRVVSGLLAGSSIAIFLLLMFNVALRANVRPRERVLQSWPEYVGMLLADAIVLGMIWLGPTWLYYPLAIGSVIGIIGVLFTTNVFVVGMMSGFEHRVLTLRNLARPGTIALSLTAIELGGLALLRTWLESAMPM